MTKYIIYECNINIKYNIKFLIVDVILNTIQE